MTLPSSETKCKTHKSFKNLLGTIFSHDSDHTKPKITNWVNKKVVSFVFIIRLV